MDIKSFSALMLLVWQQEGHLACKKTERWGTGMVICLGRGRGAHMHMAQLMPLPLTISCSSNFIQIGFTFLVLPFWKPAHRVVPDKIQRAVKRL